MTDLDLERLGDVWRQQPDPAELDRLRVAAEKVRRRARWLQLVDVVAAVFVAGVVLWMVLLNPTVDTMLVGGGAILVLLISQIRSRRFRQQELRSLTGSAEQMLEQSIERVRATLKRARSVFIVVPPGLLLGIVVTYVADHRSGGEVTRRIGLDPAFRIAVLAAAAAMIVGLMIQAFRTIRQSRRELDRLNTLRDSYRQEGEADQP